MKKKYIILGLIILLIVSGCKPAEEEPATTEYIGCYEDDYERDLSGFEFTNSDLTPSMCIDKCSEMGFKYAATQYETECYCDNDYGMYGEKPDEECNYECGGDPDSYCGGYWRNMVYRVE
ncbi:WSC domain-containing protein [Candidatus Woesearchaeota archaeon]|nr:WSC domain-containing protein [Candidatus Woesearchaeota archaeon]